MFVMGEMDGFRSISHYEPCICIFVDLVKLV